MGSFAAFIESDAFFPVLILLLVVLMLLFFFILNSGKNNIKRREIERKNVPIDENAQVQLVQNPVVAAPAVEPVNLEPIVETPKVEEPTPIIEEIKNDVPTTNSVIEEVIEEIPKMETPKIETPVVSVDLSEVEFNIPEKKFVEEDMSEQYNVLAGEIFNETPSEDEIVSVELTKPTPANEDIGEEFDVPHPIMADESNEVPIIEEEKVEAPKDAFKTMPNGDTTINEAIEADTPKEYVSEKTEILDFPDFDSFGKDISTDIDTQIIDAANKYIESVMSNK